MRITWQGEVLRVPIPKGREPFINTPLLPVGPDESGRERFWISSWNSNVGCMGVLVDERGEHRIYRFPGHGGFYSAVAQDADTLWLCGNTSCVVRLTLSTGRYERFDTGAPGGLVFSGMALDQATGKIFFSAHTPPTITGVSFDIRAKKAVKVYSQFSEDHYIRSSFPNGDGTHTIVFHCPRTTFLRWDPRSETVEANRLPDVPGESLCLRTICDERGRRYVPGLGWYDGTTGQFDASGPKPEREMTWFARRGTTAYGYSDAYHAWDMETGAVRRLCDVGGEDYGFMVSQLTRAGKLVCVTLYGVFCRFDAGTGQLECSRRLPTDSIGHVDCLLRLDKDRLLGTPFITQRFWEANLRTGKGFDCGRAAPGGGEVLQAWKLGGKVYMAAYTGGELVEYDPKQHPHFPENPRVVADPPGGMRPVAAADDGRHVFYSCSAHYGDLGSVVTKYDTKTGLATYAQNPLPHQQICSLFYDRRAHSLLCGTTMEADCASATPAEDVCYLARLSADELGVIEKFPLPKGTQKASVLGPLGRGRWLCEADGGHEARWFVLSDGEFRAPSREQVRPFPPRLRRAIYAGKTGLFILHREERIELWDMRKQAMVQELARDRGVYKVHVQEGSVYLVRPREVVVLEGCLRRAARPR